MTVRSNCLLGDIPRRLLFQLGRQAAPLLSSSLEHDPLSVAAVDLALPVDDHPIFDVRKRVFVYAIKFARMRHRRRQIPDGNGGRRET
jgi:hypothetical protein